MTKLEVREILLAQKILRFVAHHTGRRDYGSPSPLFGAKASKSCSSSVVLTSTTVASTGMALILIFRKFYVLKLKKRLLAKGVFYVPV
jgi:hypothetical protein